MKKLYIGLLVTMASWLSVSGQECIENGGFESGFTGYDFTRKLAGNTFNYQDCHIDTSDPTIFQTYTLPTSPDSGAEGATLVTPGNEPTLAAASPAVIVNRVATGNRSLRLNNTSAGGDISTMTQGFTATGHMISFDFLLIVENPHPTNPNVQPFFTARIINPQNGQIVSLNEICIKADTNNGLFFPAEDIPGIGDVLHTGWVCHHLLIPDDLIDSNLVLEFVVGDCGLGDHFGQVYIDNISCGAACDEPDFGSVALDGLVQSCPTEPFDVCGTYFEPTGGTLSDIELQILQNGVVVSTITTTSSLAAGTFCFEVEPSDFGVSPTGDFEFLVVADFTIGTFTWEIFDSSANPGPDISFNPVNIDDAYVDGSTLIWDDIAPSYELEFFTDGSCCPGGIPGPEQYFHFTVTDNFFDLNELFAALRAATGCYRYRIFTDCGGWSPWCCVAFGDYDFPDENDTWGNPIEPDCYDGEATCCQPVLYAEIDVTSGNTSIEYRELWIQAVNTIHSGAEARYYAGDYIELLPTFTAQYGSVFTAIIEECPIECPDPLPRYNMFAQGEMEEDENEEHNHIHASDFTVHPNPTNGRITVIGEEAVGVFTIIDITGKELMRVENAAGAKQVDIDLSGLTTGVYFVSADGVTIQKVIKN